MLKAKAPERVSVKNSGEEFRETKTSDENRGSGKSFAVSKTNEIKRIHAARIRLTSIVWKTGEEGDDCRGIRVLTSPRYGTGLLQYLSRACNIQDNGGCATLLNARSVYARPCRRYPVVPFPSRIERYSVVRNSLIPTYLPGKHFTNHRSRDSARYLWDMYMCMLHITIVR